jgi:hypothetical protein
MFGAYTGQLAADIAAKAIKGATLEGSERGFEALVRSGPPWNTQFRVAVDANKSFLTGFDRDPEYDGALSFVDDAGNVVRDEAGKPITPEAAFTAFTTIRAVENEDSETMLREARPTEVWECHMSINADCEVTHAMSTGTTDWAWVSDVNREGFDPNGVLGPTYYRVTETHYYSVFFKPRPPGNPVLLKTKLNQEVAEAME